MASSKETKTGDVRIYLVSSMLFCCIVIGGSFLAMYIHHPESESTSWYPVVGMVLIGIPWIFWILTMFYTCCLKRILAKILANNNNNNNDNNKNNKIASVNVARTSGATSMATDSPGRAGNGGGVGGGGGHVRFGVATVVGEDDENDDGEGSNGDIHSNLDQESRDGGSSNGATGRSSNNGDGSNSSLGSHESELPLTFSTS